MDTEIKSKKETSNKNKNIKIEIERVKQVPLKSIIEKLTGEKFNRQNKIHCPFHEDKTPSFSLKKEENFWQCFGCRKAGSLIDFYKYYYNLNSTEATKKVLEDYGTRMNPFKTSPPQKPKLTPIENYLRNEREITKETQITYKLMLNIKSKSLEVPLGNKKILKHFPFNPENKPRYLNPKGEKDYLLGHEQAKETIEKEKAVILVEGLFDMLTLHQNGFKNVVCCLGTTLNIKQIDKLPKNIDVKILFDGDLTGQNGNTKLKQQLDKLNIFNNIRIIPCPKKEDPDTFLRKYGKQGCKELQRELQKNTSEKQGNQQNPTLKLGDKEVKLNKKLLQTPKTTETENQDTYKPEVESFTSPKPNEGLKMFTPKFLLDNEFNFLGGSTKLGKSRIILELTGRILKNKNQKGLILSSENNPEFFFNPLLHKLGLVNQFQKIKSGLEELTEDDIKQNLKSSVYLLRFIKRIDAVLTEYKPKLLLIDPLTKLFDWNKSILVAYLIQELSNLAKKHKCCIIGIRNDGKSKEHSEEHKTKGASDLEDTIRNQLRVKLCSKKSAFHKEANKQDKKDCKTVIIYVLHSNFLAPFGYLYRLKIINNIALPEQIRTLSEKDIDYRDFFCSDKSGRTLSYQLLEFIGDKHLTLDDIKEHFEHIAKWESVKQKLYNHKGLDSKQVGKGVTYFFKYTPNKTESKKRIETTNKN